MSPKQNPQNPQNPPNHDPSEEPTIVPGSPAGAEAGAEFKYTTTAEELASQLDQLTAQATEYKDLWLRAKAESDNVRKQAQADVAKAHKFAIERFAEDLLPVKDALEKTLAAGDVGLDTLRAGADLTLKSLQNAFTRAQVTELDPVGEKFDPHRHQAMQTVEANQPANTVVAVFQKGYLINDRLLRPALVTVAKGNEGAG